MNHRRSRAENAAAYARLRAKYARWPKNLAGVRAGIGPLEHAFWNPRGMSEATFLEIKRRAPTLQDAYDDAWAQARPTEFGAGTSHRPSTIAPCHPPHA